MSDTMKAIIIFLFIVAPLNLVAQKDKNKKLVYIDENYKKVKKENATYYFENKIAEENKTYIIYNQNVYYLDGNLYQTNLIKSFKSTPGQFFKFGKEIKYYPNGNVKSECQDVNSEKKGDYKEYYENGNLNSKGRIESFTKIYVYNHYDSLGLDLLINGNGKFSEFSNTFNKWLHTEVKDSLVLASYYIENSDTIYCTLNTTVEPVNGWENYYDKLKKSLDKINLNKLKPGFKLIGVLNENGNLIELKYLDPPSTKHNELILARVKNITTFKPIKLPDGRAVKYAFVLPIKII